ncbi:hypothetical protein [Acinetobacter nosocomialis]|uniref:hypothetical protein n=1 Tax=Acinetobacter nosocomialis TaxID=106654 RepID=UPI00124FD98E|nr:hypothetical protein [Acinetobacter nosocomialis]
MSESKNKLVEVQKESVEGEYLTGKEYMDLKISQYKQQAEDQKNLADDLMNKHRKRTKDIETLARMAALRPWI